MIHRLLIGYVVQKFDENEQEFVGQDFVHGETEYEDENGEGYYAIDPEFDETDLPELPALMFQPNDIGMERHEWYNVFQLNPDDSYFVCIPEEEPAEEWEGFKTAKEAEKHMEELMTGSSAEFAVVKETRTVVVKGYGDK